jgi:hypothetical protein
MKVAVCISGHIRTWYKTYKSFIQYIMPMKPDIFIQTYNQIEWQEFVDAFNNGKKILGMTNKFTNKEIDMLFSMIKPIKIAVEDYDEVLSTFKIEHEGIILNGPAGQSRTRYLCNEMRKEHEKIMGFKYDIVIRTRPDLSYCSPMEEFIKNEFYKDGKFIDNKLAIGPNLPPWYRSLNDQCAMGSGPMMNIYSDIFVDVPLSDNKDSHYVLKHFVLEDPRVGIWESSIPVPDTLTRSDNSDYDLSNADIFKLMKNDIDIDLI